MALTPLLLTSLLAFSYLRASVCTSLDAIQIPNLTPRADDFNPCNRTDGILPCPYGGTCEYPPLSCPAIGACPRAVCRRNCIDWGNGVTSTGLCVYAATTENGTKIPNSWGCDVRTEIYGTTCTSGLACQRVWTRAPPICSPVYASCDAGGGCAGGEICIVDPRRRGVVRMICISGSVTCESVVGAGGGEGRAACGVYSNCVSGVCMRMIDCEKSVYGCPGTGFNYGDG